MGPMSEPSSSVGSGRSAASVPTTNPVPMDAYDYGLPPSSIAQRPVEPRSAARLLVAPGLDDNDQPRHATIADLPILVGPGDVLVVNETKVLTGRLALTRSGGGRAEVLLLEPLSPGSDEWEALVRPGRRLPPGSLLAEDGAERPDPVVEVGRPLGGPGDARRAVRLLDPSVVERAGRAPLPPYIHDPSTDPGRYQTVYAAEQPLEDRSAAAPTAGLHLTPEVLEGVRQAGATVARLNLSIGLDTFRPITASTPEEHVIHSERYWVPAETMEACAGADRVVAMGTTVVRALESAAATGELAGRTHLYIHGGYRFRVVDALITNFHLPRSSLLLLVEAFCGPQWRRLYAEALADGYRFLSFGDAMMVARSGTGDQAR